MSQGVFNQDPLLMQDYEVAQPLRLALSPIMDGVVTKDEWESLSTSAGGPTFFQWEPGKLYWAAKPLPGMDVVLSLDMANDGWLTGKDNIEIRASQVGDQVRVAIRQLDATDRNNPVWIAPNVVAEALKIASKPSDEYWNFEASFAPIFADKLPQLNDQIRLRLDCVPQQADLGPAYTPRSLDTVRLRFDQSINLFSGLTWRPDISNRSLARVESVTIQYNFEALPGTVPIQSLSVEGEGYAENAITDFVVPFPDLTNRQKAAVEYKSDINDAAIGGYRIVRATLKDALSNHAVLRTSIKISELVEIEVSLPRQVEFSQEDRVIRGFVSLQSRTAQNVNGSFDYLLPESWIAKKGKELDFLIFNPRDDFRVPIEFIVPRGSTGVFPFSCVVNVNGRTLYETAFISIR